MATDTIRTSKWYFSTPDAIFDVDGIDIYAQTIYILLCAHADREGKSFPSYETLAKRGRMSRRKAIDSVAALVDRGLLLKKAKQRDNGGDTSNEYTIVDAYDFLASEAELDGSAQHALGGVHNMHRGSAQHAPKHNHLSLPSLHRQLDSASAEVAAAIEFDSDRIYEALKDNVSKFVYVANNVPAGDSVVDAIFMMLLQPEFNHKRSPEVVRIACETFYDRYCTSDPDGNVRTRAKDPVAAFHGVYMDAVKLYKVKARKNVPG